MLCFTSHTLNTFLRTNMKSQISPFENAKLKRINTIYEHLLKVSSVGESLSSRQLADILQVSVKTIQRDLQGPLLAMGAIKKGRGWAIDKSRAIDNLNNDERLVLHILDEIAKGVGELFYLKAHTLLTQLSNQLDNPIFTHLDCEGLSTEDLKMFIALENAIKSRIEIRFYYAEYSRFYRIKPLKLALFDGFWYLLGFDLGKESAKKSTLLAKQNSKSKQHPEKEIFKKFYVKNISNIELSNQTFEVPNNVEERLKRAHSAWFSFNDSFFVRLLIDKQIAKYFKRKPKHSQRILGEYNDGSLEIELEVTSEMEILPLVFYYLPHVKILEPSNIAKSAKSIIEGYLRDISG